MVATFILSIVVNIGMWFERFVIIVTSLHRDFFTLKLGDVLPPHYTIWAFFLFTLGLFFYPLSLVCQIFPYD